MGFTVVTFVAGGLSGAVVDLVMFPLDTIKTRLQARRLGKQAAKDTSFRAFYRGLLPAMLVSFPSAATFWLSYEAAKSTIVPAAEAAGFGFLGPSLAAGCAEIAVAAVRNPFEVVKQQLQSGIHSGSAVAVRTILARDGWRGLYAGAQVTVLRDIPFDAVQFGLYEGLKRAWIARKRRAASAAGGAAEAADAGSAAAASTTAAPIAPVTDLVGWENGLLGMLCGGFAAAVTTPLDVVKTRLMTQAGSGPAPVAAPAPSTAPAATAQSGASAPAAASGAGHSSAAGAGATAGAGAPAAASASAPASASAAAPPHDSGHGQHVRYRGVVDCFRRVVREEGAAALLSGIKPRVLWISLGGAIYIGTFEEAKRRLGGGAAVPKDRD